MDSNDDSGKFEDVSKSKNKAEQLTWIIVIVISFICGLTVFFIMLAIFNNTGEEEVIPEPPKEEKVSLQNTNVKALYKYVTYGTRGKRNDKFFKESVTTLESFTNQERFYYALQFVKKEDLTYTEEKNSRGEPIYNISDRKMGEYMQRFFGNKVSYSSKVSFTYPFQFAVNGKNLAVITTSATDGYDVTFSRAENNLPKDLVEPFYAKLYDAYIESDGSYRLEEKVIFTTFAMNNNRTYNVNIYSDYNHTKLIDSILGISEASLKEKPISVDTYLNNAATISYHFDISGSIIYFESSRYVTNEKVIEDTNA